MKTVCKFLVAGVVLWNTLGFAQEAKGFSENPTSFGCMVPIAMKR